MHPAFLEANATLDAVHPAVIAFARRYGTGTTPVEKAVALNLAVRDLYRYNPWNVYFTPPAYRASEIIARAPTEGAHCIDKAVVVAAAARVLGIPSRLHFADVKNHLGTARLEEKMGTDLLVYHGYVGLFLENKWVSATPAFNRELCERLGVAPLDFDGKSDSVFQAYDREVGRFMEYITDHGSFADIPFEAMFSAWKKHYGASAEAGWFSELRSSAQR